MTPSLLPESFYDLDHLEGVAAASGAGMPIVKISAPTLARHGSFGELFEDAFSEATANAVKEASKIALGVAIHFTPPNGKSVTPLSTTTGVKGVKALKRRIATELMPAVFNAESASGIVPTAIPGGDPANPTPVEYQLSGMPVPDNVIPRGVGGWAFVQPRGKVPAGVRIDFVDPLQIVRSHGYFTKARKSDNVRRFANKKWRLKPMWVRPGGISKAVKALQQNAGRLLSGWHPAVQALGYGNRNRADFIPGADGTASFSRLPSGEPVFSFSNRELKDLQVARIRKGLSDRILQWSQSSIEAQLPNIRRKFLKELKTSFNS